MRIWPTRLLEGGKKRGEEREERERIGGGRGQEGGLGKEGSVRAGSMGGCLR